MTPGSASARYWQASASRLVHVREASSSELWQRHWDAYYPREQRERELRRNPLTDFVVRTTRRYLPPGSTILEGGCGIGQHVATLRRAGYVAVGLDFAVSTLRETARVMSGLPLTAGDVFALPLADRSVDGYWSLGVIEHFWNGYAGIISEMARVLRPGGYAFVTHPAVSLLRRLKARLGCYPPWCDDAEEPDGFYQFALDPRETARAFAAAGFRRQQCTARGGLKGWKDEVRFGRAALQALMDRRSLTACKAACYAIDRVLAPFAGHGVLLVFRLATDSK